MVFLSEAYKLNPHFGREKAVNQMLFQYLNAIVEPASEISTFQDKLTNAKNPQSTGTTAKSQRVIDRILFLSKLCSTHSHH